jgi:hypothetical protein
MPYELLSVVLRISCVLQFCFYMQIGITLQQCLLFARIYADVQSLSSHCFEYLVSGVASRSRCIAAKQLFCAPAAAAVNAFALLISLRFVCG